MKHDDLYHLIWLSRPLMQAAEACVEAGLTGTGLTVRQRAVLEILLSDGAVSVPDLAHRLDIKRQYVQVMVNETLEAGLVEQVPNPRHKRSPLLQLTPPGRATIADVVARERDLVARLGAGLSAAEVSSALNVLRQIIAQLKLEGSAK